MRTDRQTERRDEANNGFSQFSEERLSMRHDGQGNSMRVTGEKYENVLNINFKKL